MVLPLIRICRRQEKKSLRRKAFQSCLGQTKGVLALSGSARYTVRGVPISITLVLVLRKRRQLLSILTVVVQFLLQLLQTSLPATCNYYLPGCEIRNKNM